MAILIAAFITGLLLNRLRGVLRVERVRVMQQYIRRKRVQVYIHRLTVVYLLLHIGLTGGSEVASQGLSNIVVPGLLSIALASVLFLIALIFSTRLGVGSGRSARISLATHYGSVSIGTFAAAQSYLAAAGTPAAPSAAAWVALMELPAVLIGALVLGGGLRSVGQVLRDRDILVLLGALVVGYAGGAPLLSALAPVVVAPFEWVLAGFLFSMGGQAARSIDGMRSQGMRVLVFGLAMPLTGALLGSIAGTAAGLPVGDVALLSALAASASYVVATAVMGKLVPPDDLALSLTASLGITLPWNIVFGIPVYTSLSVLLAQLRTLDPSTVAVVAPLASSWLLPCLCLAAAFVVLLVLVVRRGTRLAKGASTRGGTWRSDECADGVPPVVQIGRLPGWSAFAPGRLVAVPQRVAASIVTSRGGDPPRAVQRPVLGAL